MLTNVVEGGQRKCEQYWPDQEPQEYGPFTVTLADQQVFADYIVRTLQVMVSLAYITITDCMSFFSVSTATGVLTGGRHNTSMGVLTEDHFPSI